MVAQKIKSINEIVAETFEQFIPGFWSRAGTNEQLLRGFSGEISELSKKISQVYDQISIETAKNSSLDEFGLLFKLSRNTGESDTLYRNRLKSYFQTFLNSGTIDGIRQSLLLLTQLNEDNIDILPLTEFKPQQFIANMEANESWVGEVSDDTTYYYEGSQAKRLTSSNSWFEVQPAGDIDKQWHTSSISSNGQVIIVGVYSGRLYLSSNGGSSWSEIQPAGNSNKEWFTSSISSDGQVIIVGVNVGRLYLSSNGGSSWSEIQPAGNSNKGWCISSISSNGQVIIAGERRLYLSSNGGSSWSEIQPAGDIDKQWYTSSISSDGQVIIVGANGGGLYLSSNGGSSWSEIQPAGNSNEGWHTSSISSNGQVIIVGVYGGRLYLSSNGGSSWSEIQPAGDNNFNWKPSSMSPDGQVIIVGIRYGRLYLSSNGGSSWSEIQPAGDVDKQWYTSSISSDGELIIGAFNDRLYFNGMISSLTTAQLTRNLNLGINKPEDIDTFRVWYHYEDLTKLENITLSFSDGTTTASLEVPASELSTNNDFVLFNKIDFTNTSIIDWSVITSISLSAEFNGASYITFDWLQFGVVSPNLKFGISIEIDETFDDSLLDAIDAAIEKAKAAGTYYNKDKTFTSRDNLFLVNFSTVNGENEIL